MHKIDIKLLLDYVCEFLAGELPLERNDALDTEKSIFGCSETQVWKWKKYRAGLEKTGCFYKRRGPQKPKMGPSDND